MKLKGFLFFGVLLLVVFSGAAQTVNLSGKDLPLKKVFTIIKKQTGVYFFYDASLLEDAKPVTITLENVSLEAALTQVFRDQPFIWSLEDKTITVVKSASTHTNPAALSSSPSNPIQVSGSITDMSGSPVSGASVLIKATRLGTIADENGRFSIKAYPNDILVFSSVSYIPKEIKVESGLLNIRLELDFKPMESLIVGGNLVALRRKADASSVTVIDAKTLEKLPVNTIDQIFRGLVPGTNSFDVGDAAEGFPTLSIRGAAGPSSLSIIAVYIDGIEYAGGSGYLSQLDKTNIDRIEIVRGPGASTLYGTGSNGGIVQIFTKKSKTASARVSITSSAGFYKSKWVDKDPFQQMHNLELSTGFKKLALTLGGSYRTVGAYLPDGGEKNKGFYGGAAIDAGKFQLNFTGRYNVRNYNDSRNPVFDTAIHHRHDIIIEPIPGYLVPAFEWYNVKPTASLNKNGIIETDLVGANIVYKTTRNWINKLDAGYTWNGNSELPVLDGMVPLQRQYLSEKSSITTIRYSNTLSLSNAANDFRTVIISGAEYKKYSHTQTYNRTTAATTFVDKDPDNENYGAFVQFNPSYKNLFLTMGLRYEKNELFNGSWNPRIGLTTNFETRLMTIKPRISWGRGISAPSYTDRFGYPPNAFSIVYANPDIKPQLQQGFDYGLELFDRKGRYRIEVVYYDNTLKDMITQIVLGPDTTDPTLEAFKSINAGKVTNRGWEFSGEYRVRHFSLQGSLSIMDAIIKDTTGINLSPQFFEKLPGSRMNNLPKHTAGLTLGYNFFKMFGKSDGGSVAFNLTEVDGILFLDFRNYQLDVAYGRTGYSSEPLGYPVETSPVYRLGLSAEYQLLPELRFFVLGSNILNDYNFEYTNDYPTHGATWLFGLKYNFSRSFP